MEIWKELPNTNYLVSSTGNVKSIDATLPHTLKSGRVIYRKYIGKDVKLQNHSAGYKQISIKKKINLVHRLVAKLFLDNPNNLEFVNHKDGNKANNSVDNLEWCTRQQNETHAYSTGLKNSTGSANKMAKLTETSAIEIKYCTDKSYDNKMLLSDRFNVHRATIERIWNNKIWTHI